MKMMKRKQKNWEWKCNIVRVLFTSTKWNVEIHGNGNLDMK